MYYYVIGILIKMDSILYIVCGIFFFFLVQRVGGDDLDRIFSIVKL